MVCTDIFFNFYSSRFFLHNKKYVTSLINLVQHTTFSYEVITGFFCYNAHMLSMRKKLKFFIGEKM